MAGDNGPIQICEAGAGFQYTPYGVLPLGTSVAPDSDDPAPAAVRAPVANYAAYVAPSPGRIAPAPVASVPTQLIAPSPVMPPTSPRSVIKAAGARMKQIKIELRRMAALKRELDELERLLRAAKQKPEPRVRALRAG